MRNCNPNNPVVILRFAILTSSSDSADRGRSIIRVSAIVECCRRRVFIICKQKTIDNCIWNLSLKFIVVRIFCYLVPVIGMHIISRFYAYVEHSEIKTKTVNTIQFPYFDLSQNVKICDVPYSLKSPRNSECN